MEKPRREGSVLAGLLGGVLLVALAVIIVSCVPVVPCSNCQTEAGPNAAWHRSFRNRVCDCCGDRMRVTLLERWSWRRGALERALRADPDRY